MPAAAADDGVVNIDGEAYAVPRWPGAADDDEDDILLPIADDEDVDIFDLN